MNRILLGVSTALLLAGACLIGVSRASDHLDSPGAANDPVADLLDLYAFVEPFCQAVQGQGCESDPDELILALTMYPDATGASQFSPEVKYHFYFENDLNETFQIDCSFNDELVIRCAGLDGLSVRAHVGEVATHGNIRVYAGLRDDPFFIDLDELEAFQTMGVAALHPPATDTQAGANVLAIVVGIKTSEFPPGSGPNHNLLKVWAASERTGGNGLNGAITGSWYNPDQSGQGFNVELTGSPFGPDQFVAYFYGYDNSGNLIWLLGSGANIQGNTAIVDVIRPVGVGFGDDFDPTTFDFDTVGTMKFTFTDCNNGSVVFTPSSGDLQAFSMNIVRLTNISSLNCSLLKNGQIDRVGRPLVSSALIPDSMRDAYNTASDPSTWSAMFKSAMVSGIAALDTADGVVGNLITGSPQALATIFIDDRLQVDIKNGQTVDYFTNELSALVPQESHDSSGRALFFDVVDISLNLFVTGFEPLLSDYVDGNDVPFLTVFPFLAPPN